MLHWNWHLLVIFSIYLSIPCGGIKVSATGRNTHLLVTIVTEQISAMAAHVVASSCNFQYLSIHPETLQKIKERTRLSMQNPKVMSCKNILMSLFNNILSILIQYHFHLLLFTISKHSISLWNLSSFSYNLAYIYY